MIELPPGQLPTIRAHLQCLSSQCPHTELTEVVRAVCGIQAQLTAAMLLALRARVPDLTVPDVEQAIAGRKLVRTWAMRGTLHIIPAEDVRWLIRLLGSRFIEKGKARRLQLGLDEEISAKGMTALAKILKQGSPLTRGELVEKLRDHGISLERRSQSPIHLINLAALNGIICLGPEREHGESTYVLMNEWIDSADPLPEDDALMQLARRYLTGFAPASPQDFAAWSGLTVTDAKKAWALLKKRDELIEVVINDQNPRTVSALKSQEKLLRQAASSADSTVRLLPAFDTYLLGYANRDDLVRPEHRAYVYHGGQTVPVVLVEGVAAGVWRYERQAKRLNITVHAFEQFTARIQEQIADQADDLGRFWDTSVSVAYSSKPL